MHHVLGTVFALVFGKVTGSSFHPSEARQIPSPKGDGIDDVSYHGTFPHLTTEFSIGSDDLNPCTRVLHGDPLNFFLDIVVRGQATSQGYSLKSCSQFFHASGGSCGIRWCRRNIVIRSSTIKHKDNAFGLDWNQLVGNDVWIFGSSTVSYKIVPVNEPCDSLST